MYYQSIKEEPLQFFISFLNKQSILMFEKEFFYPKIPINPTFVSNKEKGFITFHKDVISNSEPSQVKLYYSEELSKLISLQTDITIRFLKRRNKELLYQNFNSDKFLQLQHKKLKNLKVDIKENHIYINSLNANFDRIENCINSLLKGVTLKIERIDYQITSNSFFGLKENYRLKHLKKLYQKSIELEIFDFDIVSEEEFLNVFTSTTTDIKQIQFNVNNLLAVHYLNLIGKAFNNLSYSRLSKSKLFYNKYGKLLVQRDFDNTASRLKSKNNIDYKKISDGINEILL